MAVSSRKRSWGEGMDGSSDVGRMGVASVAHADVRSAPGRSSGNNVDVRRRFDAAAIPDMYAKMVRTVARGSERNPFWTMPVGEQHALVSLARPVAFRRKNVDFRRESLGVGGHDQWLIDLINSGDS